ncbi:MAG: protein translocase subunit SecF [Anaerolineaceae bacterium]|nr:protein translocase subunit SecF [Anaerolineaceae bacterium]MBN2678558.1 protein translocase subunit SecF [Anaerolineaceae bacterium]
MIDILGKRYLFFILSLLIILPGIIVWAINGLPLAIDFKGGSIMEISFDSGKAPVNTEVFELYKEQGITDVQVQPTADESILIIRTPFMDEVAQGDIIRAVETKFNDKVTIRTADSVGPTVGQEVASRAALAVAIAALAVVLYVTYAFRGIPHAFRYGVCAIIAMIHDVAIVMSLVNIGGKYFGWQVDSLFLTALLTVIGFSVQDKIVVFDRIRENSSILRRLPFEKLVNHSIVQTLQRSINTQLMTVEFMLLALALFGGVTLREFAVILLVGLLSGTYSSIFIAAPILVVWEKKEWKTWFTSSKTRVTTS